jgi:4-hydroxybenzoate polyprenyltransferase
MAVYGIINILYSLWLKHIVIVDVFCIASGFVLRILMGSVLISVPPSPWILICTLLLAVFMALGKRRHELLLSENESKNYRPVLENYTPYLVDQLISVVTPVTIISYILYTLDPNTIERLHAPNLFYTAIFVLLGIFRYVFIIHKKDLAGSPVEMVLKDKPFLMVVLAWVISVAFMMFPGW